MKVCYCQVCNLCSDSASWRMQGKWWMSKRGRVESWWWGLQLQWLRSSTAPLCVPVFIFLQGWLEVGGSQRQNPTESKRNLTESSEERILSIFELRNKSSAKAYLYTGVWGYVWQRWWWRGMVVYIGMLEEREHWQRTMWPQCQVMSDQ